MKFITEEDLRDLYKNAPFGSYNPEEGTRLTPGARQFLIDRGIDLYHDEDCPPMPKVAGVTAKSVQQSGGNDSKLATVMALMLESVWEMSQWDPCNAEKLRGLYRWLKECLACQDCTKSICLPCNGMKPGTFCDHKPDCFPIGEYGEEINEENQYKTTLRLHRIRCGLREINSSPIINQAINGVSQLICANLGGGKCKTQ